MGDGQAGLGHPPWRGGGGQAEVSARESRGFLKGSKRPEAGCLGERAYLQTTPFSTSPSRTPFVHSLSYAALVQAGEEFLNCLTYSPSYAPFVQVGEEFLCNVTVDPLVQASCH